MEKSPIKNDWQIKSLYLIYPKDFKKTTVADIVFSKNSSNLALKKPCFCPGYSNKSQRAPTCSTLEPFQAKQYYPHSLKKI